MSVTIKANSYCPICRGVHLSDKSHEDHLFLSSYFDDFVKAKERAEKAEADLARLTSQHAEEVAKTHE